MTAVSKNWPKLRFPGFSDEWEVKRLAGLCGMKAGKFIPAEDIKQDNTPRVYPCYGGNGLRGYVAKFSHAGSYSLIGRQGALCGNVNYVSGQFYATEHAVVVYPKPYIDSKWLYYQLKRLNLNRFATGQAQPGLSVDDILHVKQVVPHQKSEQEKIAGFLTVVDERIELLEKKIELQKKYKKAVTQKIFTQQIRFRDSDGKDFSNWEEGELKNICDRFMVPMRDKPKNLTGSTPWCRIEDFDGKYLYESKSNQGVSPAEIKRVRLTVFPKGTLIVSCSANLGECAVAGVDLVTNQTFIGLSVNSANSLDFMYHLMRYSKRRLNILSSGTTISYLSREGFEKLKVSVPPKIEQQKIADFLTAIDEKIKLEEAKLTQAKTFKKSLLQRMFV